MDKPTSVDFYVLRQDATLPALIPIHSNLTADIRLTDFTICIPDLTGFSVTQTCRNSRVDMDYC